MSIAKKLIASLFLVIVGLCFILICVSVRTCQAVLEACEETGKTFKDLWST